MRSVTVEVTQSDINQGTKNDCFTCPVAIAVNRALGIDNAEIGEYVGSGNDVDGMVVEFDYNTIKLDNSVRDFIYGFDLGHDVDPIKFQLVVP